jgi:hypothetical protein
MSSANLWTVFTRANIIRLLHFTFEYMCVLALWVAAFLAVICADLWLIVVERPWSLLAFGGVL